MPKKQVSPQSAVPPSKIKGKTIVLACHSSDDSTLGETSRLLALLGGEVVREVTPSLDYLVVLDQRLDRTSEEERQVNSLGEAGGAIRILDWSSFRDLLSPTPEEAVALLRGGDAGLEQWRLRRNTQSQDPIDLSGVDLRGAKLTGIVLYRVKLDDADLRDAELSGSSLGDLVRVNLDGARLPGAYVPHLTDCSARHADLSNVRFNPAVIVRTDFTGAKLADVFGSYTRSEQVVFRDADLTRAQLQNSMFPEANFDGANLTQAFLDNCDLTGATLRKANLTRASFSRAKLVNANLSNANLAGANLAGADLTGATIERANFEGANLYATNLSALGPGRPLRLTPPPPVALERIGPNMRLLEAVWQRTGSLETSLHIDPDGREANFVQLVIVNAGRAVEAFSSKPDGTHRCQADTLCEAMLELAQLWPGAELYLETLHVRSGSVRETPKELPEQALAAWHEAFALTLPSPAERKARQKAHRQRFLEMLRGGPEGIRRWNAFRSETLTRAGHFRRADLANCNLQGVNLSNHHGSCFGRLDFQGANFAGANLTGGSLHDCSLVKSCFRGAVLDNVDCASANLRQADFEGASLRGCNMRLTRCREANFRNTDLYKAHFGKADLRGADLSSAKLERARFEATKHDATTLFPAGFVFPVKSDKGQPSPPSLEVGGRVRVTFGAFAGLEGEVKEIRESTGTSVVELTIFGRAVPVELEYDDVEQV
jgi:uncharacterized protein YjbI with pentapeptide repeats